jgi:hypothetical protein
MEIDDNEIADQSARNSSSHPLVGLQPAFGTTTEDAKGVSKEWIRTKHDHYSSHVDNGKTAGELLNLRLNQLRVLLGLTGNCVW